VNGNVGGSVGTEDHKKKAMAFQPIYLSGIRTLKVSFVLRRNRKTAL